jgi:CRP/FNR family transcriptional regulator
MRTLSQTPLPGPRHAYSSVVVRNTDPGSFRRFSERQVLRSPCQHSGKLQVLLSGYAKISAPSETGQEDILGFAMPGDILGLGALGTHTIPSDIIFFTEAVTGELTLEDAIGLEGSVGGLGNGVGDLISRELLRTQWRNRFVRNASVRTRVAQFLLELGRRFDEIDLPSHKFRLFMPREDMAIFLGMTQCTLSRTLHVLCKSRLIAIDGSRWIEILDPVKLNQV